MDVEPKPRKRAQQRQFEAASEKDSPARGRSVDAEARSRRPCRQRKELISRKFLKPSNGLEPLTPSLPLLVGIDHFPRREGSMEARLLSALASQERLVKHRQDAPGVRDWVV